jgi:hypothetical protein
MLSTDHPLGLVCVGILAGILLTVALSFPRVGRAIGTTVSVILMAAGAGFFAWGIAAMRSETFEPMGFGPIILASAAQTLGWGVGTLVGGITALVLAFVGPQRSNPR